MKVSTEWRKTSYEVPAEGQVVETISEGRIQQKLKRVGKLWFHPDGKMYVYYVPLFWRTIHD